jgi:hypothetical protein
MLVRQACCSTQPGELGYILICDILNRVDTNPRLEFWRYRPLEATRPTDLVDIDKKKPFIQLVAFRIPGALLYISLAVRHKL